MMGSWLLLAVFVAAVFIDKGSCRAKPEVTWYDQPKVSNIKLPYLQGMSINATADKQVPQHDTTTSMPPTPLKTITDVINERKLLKSEDSSAVANKSHEVPVIPMKRPSVYCFPESSTVQLSDNHRIPMKELKIGDRVKTLDARGYHGYSDVIGFLHRVDGHVIDYLSIKLANGKHLRVSDKHLVFKGKMDSRRFEEIFASQVKEGDCLVTEEGSENSKGVRLSRVLQVTMTTGKGVYAPLTRDGTMLVDGILVSCYAHWDSHQVAHAAVWPLRAWANVKAAFGSFIGWFPVSQPVSGIHWYAESLISMVQMFSQLK
uniref:Hint1 n=2 Tax=Nematostella vectensis TaxID=45351 RepID=B6CGL2_NEMVE|nr:hint1 [Nematostella vectensis]